MADNKRETLHQKVFFSVPRHKLIAARAQKLLSDETEGRIAQVLSGINATSLSAIAGWADEIKHRDATPDDDQDTKDFKADPKNKNMGAWHYVDLPLGCTGYDRRVYADFTRDDDVVQMTLESMRVLSGQSDRFSEINALRLLVHLVGDLHQPLHIACGYIRSKADKHEIVTDPVAILKEKLNDDIGGNNCLLDVAGKRVSLHSYWDSALELGGGHHTHAVALRDEFEESIARFVALPSSEHAVGLTEADWETEVTDWANESLRAARIAYDQIVITGKNDKNKFEVEYRGSGSYEKKCLPVVQERIRLASERLAQLLEAVYGSAARRVSVRSRMAVFAPPTEEEGVNLVYGGQETFFKKSDTLIGLKTKSTRSSIQDLADSNIRTTGQKLAGFELASVSETREGTNRTLDRVRASETVRKGTHVYYTSDCNAPFVPTGEIYIEFKDGTDPTKAQKLLADSSLKILQSSDDPLKLVVGVTSRSKNPVKVAADLQKSELVSVAEPDFDTPVKLHASLDPKIKDQWHLRNTGTHRGSSIGFKKGADARVLDAWELLGGHGDSSIVIGIIDDGFDLTHPDLSRKQRIVGPMNFGDNSNDPSPRRYYEEEEIVDDVGEWHGTACAGVAVGDLNGTGIAGAAPGCAFMPMKWSSGLTDREIESWFDYVKRSGAAVASCSWGALAKNFPLSARKKAAIKKCAQEGRHGLGVVVLFAAGNENRDVNNPTAKSVNGFAIHPDVIAVAASTSMDEKAYYSNFGKEITISAPSSGDTGEWGILTSDVTGTYIQEGDPREVAAGYAKGDFDEEFGGTSSATPLVAGICGLILSANPQLTAAEVKEILIKSARKVEKMKDKDHTTHFGYGCVDAAAAVKIAIEKKMKPAVEERAKPKAKA